MHDELKAEIDAERAAEAEMEKMALEFGREQWNRRQQQRKLEERAVRLLSKYQPQRSTKHPKGATKASVAARKAKNRKKAKANRRNR